jgi:CIC family chloride channel protein
MENFKKLFFFSVVAGLSTGLAVSFYVLLSKGFAYAFYLGNPLETVPKLPFWYVTFITTSSIFITLMSIGALVGYGFGFNVEPFYFAAIGPLYFLEL